MAVGRSFPKLTTDHGATLLIPLDVTYPEWSDPALNFRELAQFLDPNVQGLWDGLEFTTMDLILEVCGHFDEFMNWFSAATAIALDKIRDSAMLMTKLQSRLQWVEHLDVKVFKIKFKIPLDHQTTSGRVWHELGNPGVPGSNLGASGFQ